MGALGYAVSAAGFAAAMPTWLLNGLYGVLKALLIIVFISLNALFLIWMERKVAGRIQNRPGPTRTGPAGLLQTAADGLKLLVKEDVIPAKADRALFILAPMVIFAAAVTLWVVIPFGPGLVVQDLNIGLIFIAAISSMTVLSLLMAGWGSNNKWSLLGAMRSAAQLVTYEVPLILAVAGVAVLAGSLKLSDIVTAQQQGPWFIFLQPIGFLVFLVAGLAELNRAPFDMPEAESELVAGFNTEYSGMRWAIFFLAEYANLLAMGAICATLYLGGWSGPVLPPFVWMFIKTYAYVFFAMWVRWTLPRIRIDHLMNLGWYILIPLSVINLGIAGVYVLLKG